MSESTFTQTGVTELRAAIERFPDDQTAALKAVASDSAHRIALNAKRILASQLKTGATELIDLIEVVEDAPNKQYIVLSQAPAGEPKNVTIWNEYGTVNRDATDKMAARPYMRPSADAERETYFKNVETAAATAAAKTFSGG